MIKTKIAQQAPKYILTIMEDDMELLEKRRVEVWEVKKQEIVLKGFRKGHVPQEHAENAIGYDNLYEDVIREVVIRGIKESGQRVVGVGQASIDMFTKGKPVVVRVEVWLEPAVHVTLEGKKLYEGLEVESPDTTVEEPEIDAVVQRVRESVATTKTVERESQTGDVVVVDFEGKLEDGSPFRGNKANDYQVIVGSGILLAEFEAQLLGVKAGEVKEVKLTFPPTWPAKDLAGKKAVFTTTIKEVKERNLPEVNDELGKQFGVEDLATARAKIRENLILNKEQQGRAQVEQQLLTGLIRAVPVDPIPQSMIQQQTNILVQNMLEGVGMTLEEYLKKAKVTEEDLINQHQQAAVIDVRSRLILRAIADAENLTVTPEEEEAALKMAHETQFKNMELETLRQQIDRDALVLNIRVQRAVNHVREKMVPKVKLQGGPALQQQ